MPERRERPTRRQQRSFSFTIADEDGGYLDYAGLMPEGANGIFGDLMEGVARLRAWRIEQERLAGLRPKPVRALLRFASQRRRRHR